MCFKHPLNKNIPVIFHGSYFISSSFQDVFHEFVLQRVGLFDTVSRGQSREPCVRPECSPLWFTYFWVNSFSWITVFSQKSIEQYLLKFVNFLSKHFKCLSGFLSAFSTFKVRQLTDIKSIWQFVQLNFLICPRILSVFEMQSKQTCRTFSKP